MSDRQVPFFNYPALFLDHEQALLDVVRSVGSRGAFIMQSDLQDFEKRLAEYVGARFAIGVGNATDAMEMFLSMAGIGPGDEVIICSHTMIATASAIHAVGAVPVPVEAGWDHLIDPASVRKAITSQSKAIMPTQLNGRTCDMDEIGEIASENNLLIFEDSAQALGSKFRGRCAGTFGVAGCISFYPAKILGALGDGGAILCSDPDLAQQLLLARDHGRESSGDIGIWGRNSRLDNLQAAVLNYFLDHYQTVVDRRREIARMYEKRLNTVDALVLPPSPDADTDHFDVFQNYEIRATDRDELRQHLTREGVGTIIQWGGRAVHQFRRLGFTQELPVTDELFEQLLLLPMNVSLDDGEVHYVCDKIEAFYG